LLSRPAPLAILGGAPRFSQNVYVGTPNIGDRAALTGRIDDALNRRWLTNNGPLVQEFERRLGEITGVEHCIAVCNATTGLEIALRGLDLTGEVIVPSFTFIATVHSVSWLGLTPVFCDVDPVTHNLDPAQVEKLITPRTSAIMGVHLWGRGCAPTELEAIAKKHGLKLIFDAAHAFGCSHDGRMIGSFGDLEVFSFHATKFVNCLEGGAILCRDAALADRLRKSINFGFTGYDKVVSLGINGKMNEFSAAMGLTSLDAMDKIVATNRANWHLYRDGLAGLPGVAMTPYSETDRQNWHYVVCEIDEEITGLSRDDLLAALWAERVIARRYFFPGCHAMEPYRSLDPDIGKALPETGKLSRKLLQLPNGTAIDSAAIHQCCDLIRQIIAQRDAVKARLAEHPELALAR